MLCRPSPLPLTLPSPSRRPSPSLPSCCRYSIHCSCCSCCTVNRRRVAVALPSCLPLPSSPSRCHRTIHRRPSPAPLGHRRAVLLPLLPLPSLLLSPSPPPPTFADPFVGWLLCCCLPSAFAIAFCHATRQRSFCRPLWSNSPSYDDEERGSTTTTSRVPTAAPL